MSVADGVMSKLKDPRPDERHVWLPRLKSRAPYETMAVLQAASSPNFLD